VKQELQDSLVEVDEEVENLDDRMLYIDDILEFEHAAAEQMRDMMRLRKSRNPREAAKDEVDHALKAFYEELKGSLFTQLLSDCKKYRRVLHKLRPELDRNIQLKTEAARVDLECLNIQPDGEGLASHKSSPSRYSPASRRKVSTTSSVWRCTAEEMVQQAKAKVALSVTLRSKLDVYIDRRMEISYESILKERVQGSLEAKLEALAEERNGTGGLAEYLEEVQADMDSSQESLEELKATISEHAASLEIAQTRLRTRETKPDGERVRDEANLALEEEGEHLMRAITRLHIQRKRVIANYDRLVASAKELERAIAEKESCLETDEQILAQSKELADEFSALLEGKRDV